MSSAAKVTLSLRKREAIAASTSPNECAVSQHPQIREPSELDSARLIQERQCFHEQVAKRAEAQRAMEECQATVASFEAGGADSRVMPHRRALRDLKEKLAVLDKRIEQSVAAVLSAQKHQDEWYAMRDAAHDAWGFALAQDYLAGGVDAARWQETLQVALADAREDCEVAVRGLDLIKDMQFSNHGMLIKIYKLWGKAIEHALTSGKILADDMVDVLKQQMVGDARRHAIIAVHQLIEHAPPQLERAEEVLYPAPAVGAH